MKNKQTLYAGIALFVLAIVYYFTQAGDVATKSININKLAFTSSELATVKISGSVGEHVFEKKADQWELDGYPVDTLRMNRFISTMSELTIDRLVTKKPEKQVKYELEDTATTIQLLAADGKPLQQLIIGKNGANYMETFVREVGEDEIYAAKASLSQYKSFAPKNFWDRTMVELNVDTITDVVFSGAINYQLHREGPVWTYNGEQVDLEKVTTMLKPLEHMKGNGFSELNTEESPLYQSIQISLENGESIGVDFYKKDDKATSLLVSVSDRAKNFEYSKSSLNRFDKEIDELKAEE